MLNVGSTVARGEAGYGDLAGYDGDWKMHDSVMLTNYLIG